MVHIDPALVQLRTRQNAGKTFIFDPVRKKWLVLTPEEYVRQTILAYVVNTLSYPPGVISVEKKIMVGTMSKRFDIVVYDRAHEPWMLIECKSPDVPISENTLRQLLQYQQAMQCNYWVLSNGPQTYCADACDITDIKWLDALPLYQD